jgi:hypothetical protein
MSRTPPPFPHPLTSALARNRPAGQRCPRRQVVPRQPSAGRETGGDRREGRRLRSGPTHRRLWSGNILHRHFLHVVSLAMKHRLGGLDRHADHGLRREGHGSRRRSRPPRRAASVPSATHGSMAATSDLAFGPIRIWKMLRHFCVLLLCHFVHSFHGSYRP